jgi:hypothetical protein
MRIKNVPTKFDLPGYKHVSRGRETGVTAAIFSPHGLTPKNRYTELSSPTVIASVHHLYVLVEEGSS